MPHDVFLSYASADRAAAAAVCAALEARGITCWVAPRDVRAGEDWGEAILTAIGRAHAMVLILSRHTAGSIHVRNEVVTAVSQSLALVPVRIEDCQPGGALRLHLAGAHWLDVYPPPVEPHADALAAGVRLALAADATIEIPRGQAAALVAAARASQAAAARPAAAPAPAPMTPPGRPVAVVPPRPEAARAPAGVPAPHLPAPHLPKPRPTKPRPRRGMVVAIAALVAVAALCAAAWKYEPRLREMLGAAAAIGSGAGAGSPVAAAARVLNAANETISRLYVAPGAEDLGREDWLGQAQVTPGNAVLIRAPAGQGCVFVIRAVYVGGGIEDRPGTDLCAAPELRFEGSRPVGAASSR